MGKLYMTCGLVLAVAGAWLGAPALAGIGIALAITSVAHDVWFDL